MQKVLIVGCSGSGKSTFARKLQAQTQLELIHLDQLYWQPNWKEPSKAAWALVLEPLLQKPSWIMDGTFGATLDGRLEKADTIFVFDFPTWKCLWRVLSRTFRFWGRSRPDMAEGCNERFDLDFLHYILTFRLIRRKRLLARIYAKEAGKKIILFKRDLETEAFLESLAQKNRLGV